MLVDCRSPECQLLPLRLEIEKTHTGEPIELPRPEVKVTRERSKPRWTGPPPRFETQCKLAQESGNPPN